VMRMRACREALSRTSATAASSAYGSVGRGAGTGSDMRRRHSGTEQEGRGGLSVGRSERDLRLAITRRANCHAGHCYQCYAGRVLFTYSLAVEADPPLPDLFMVNVRPLHPRTPFDSRSRVGDLVAEVARRYAAQMNGCEFATLLRSRRLDRRRYVA